MIIPACKWALSGMTFSSMALRTTSSSSLFTPSKSVITSWWCEEVEIKLDRDPLKENDHNCTFVHCPYLNWPNNVVKNRGVNGVVVEWRNLLHLSQSLSAIVRSSCQSNLISVESVLDTKSPFLSWTRTPLGVGTIRNMIIFLWAFFSLFLSEPGISGVCM